MELGMECPGCWLRLEFINQWRGEKIEFIITKRTWVRERSSRNENSTSLPRIGLSCSCTIQFSPFYSSPSEKFTGWKRESNSQNNKVLQEQAFLTLCAVLSFWRLVCS